MSIPASTRRLSSADHIPCVLTACILASALTGCASSDATVAEQRATGGATPQTFRNVSVARVYEAGAAAMGESFESVRISHARGMIEAGPQSYTQQGGTQRVTDAALRPTYHMRRFGTLWISEDEDGVHVNCQVRVQRMDTTDYRSLRTHEEFSDLPTETPIDKDAGLTADQRQAWTELARDQTLERQLLGAINQRLRGPTEGGAPPQT